MNGYWDLMSIRSQNGETTKHHPMQILLRYLFIIVRDKPLVTVITDISSELITEPGISSPLIGNFLPVTLVLGVPSDIDFRVEHATKCFF